MTSKNSGVVRKISEAAGNNVISSHCFIHHEALVKSISNDYMVVVKVGDIIKGKSLNSRHFEMLCLEMRASYTHLLFITVKFAGCHGPVFLQGFTSTGKSHIFLVDLWSDLSNLFCNEA